MIGISSNDVVTYPQDGPDQMVAEARRHGWTFPYTVTFLADGTGPDHAVPQHLP